MQFSSDTLQSLQSLLIFCFCCSFGRRTYHATLSTRTPCSWRWSKSTSFKDWQRCIIRHWRCARRQKVSAYHENDNKNLLSFCHFMFTNHKRSYVGVHFFPSTSLLRSSLYSRRAVSGKSSPFINYVPLPSGTNEASVFKENKSLANDTQVSRGEKSGDVFHFNASQFHTTSTISILPRSPLTFARSERVAVF